MGISAWVIRAVAVVFAVYGLAFVAAPAPLSQFVTGAAPATASGLIDMRATYGGMSVAVGALLWVSASRPSSRRIGLLGVLLLLLGMAGGRAVGLICDGPANAMMVAYLLLELAGAALAAWLLRRPDEAL